MRSNLIALACLLAPASAYAAAHWQRIICIDDPKLTVTLLLKSEASPADEEFVGFELRNRTGTPLRLGNFTHYRLDDVRTADRDTGKPLSLTSMASGNSYDLVWRNGQRPADGPREDSIPPGVTRVLAYASAYSFAILGWPTGKGWTVQGRAHFTLGLPGNVTLKTPQAGVPFKFDWVPADEPGVAALRRRLRRTLAEPKDWLADAYVLGVLLKRDDVASAASVEELLAGWKRADQPVRPTIRQFVDAKFAAAEPVVAFALAAIRARDPQLLMEVAQAEHLRDGRLVEPLMQWMREQRPPPEPYALQMLKRHRELIRDRGAVSVELAKLVLARSSFVGKGEFPAPGAPLYRWEWEVRDLALTGDPTAARYLLPYLARKEVVVDARWVSTVNNGISERACDCTYNAILDLLDRPDERFSMAAGVLAPGRPAPEKEYARRDVLIERLKIALTPPARTPTGPPSP